VTQEIPKFVGIRIQHDRGLLGIKGKLLKTKQLHFLIKIDNVVVNHKSRGMVLL